jgi:predicted ferric reductase
MQYQLMLGKWCISLVCDFHSTSMTFKATFRTTFLAKPLKIEYIYVKKKYTDIIIIIITLIEKLNEPIY